MTLMQTATEVLALEGDLDEQSASQLRKGVQDLPPGARVVVDLSGVPFVDSVGVGALIGAIRRVQELGGSVTLASPSLPVAHLLRITGVSDLVPVIHACTAAGARPVATGAGVAAVEGGGAGGAGR